PVEVSRNRRRHFCRTRLWFYPIEMTIDPRIHKSDEQYQNKNNRLYYRIPPPQPICLFPQISVGEYGRPREEKKDLHFKQNENQCNDVEPDVELSPRRGDRLFATLISRKLFRIRSMGTKASRHQKRNKAEYNSSNDIQQYLAKS